MKKKFRNQSKNKTFNFLRYLGPGLLVTVGFIDPETGLRILRRAPDSDMSYCGW